MLDFSALKYSQDEQMQLCTEMPTFTSTNDWAYAMRRNMQEIIPGLFLGPYASAQRHSLKALLEQGVSHIVCVREHSEAHIVKPHFDDHFITYLTLDISDTTTENVIRFFPKVRLFIDGAFQRNGKVLVHGTNGISRSATLVLAYIMEKYGLSACNALDWVKKRRGCVHPNEGFLAQLFEYEPIYKARQMLDKGESSCDNRRQKRKSELLSENEDYDLIQPPPSPISDNNNDQNCQPDFGSNLYQLWQIKISKLG